ncbi:MAG: signal peptidase I [Ndongobacter sp.]|nr:signal peptidase I [Ndongobacter sp.]
MSKKQNQQEQEELQAVVQRFERMEARRRMKQLRRELSDDIEPNSGKEMETEVMSSEEEKQNVAAVLERLIDIEQEDIRSDLAQERTAETVMPAGAVPDEAQTERPQEQPVEAQEAPSERAKQEKKKSRSREAWGMARSLLIALVVALGVRFFIGSATTVQGESMVPTLQSGDMLIVSKLPAYTNSFARGDIVVLDAPNEEGKFYIKRVVGLPGETVRIEDGTVYIDGKQLKEFYSLNGTTVSYATSEWRIGEDEYFVMGDNRGKGKSNDSRLFGPISGERIEGVAIFRLWPISKWGTLF